MLEGALVSDPPVFKPSPVLRALGTVGSEVQVLAARIAYSAHEELAGVLAHDVVLPFGRVGTRAAMIAYSAPAGLACAPAHAVVFPFARVGIRAARMAYSAPEELAGVQAHAVVLPFALVGSQTAPELSPQPLLLPGQQRIVHSTGPFLCYTCKIVAI
jgi:hypothetical protein